MEEENKSGLEGIKDQLESLEETINNKFDELIEVLRGKKNDNTNT
ncbi:MAG: hypothetical protein WC494_01325 [Candidatus Pacearchaeota archaeon]